MLSYRNMEDGASSGCLVDHYNCVNRCKNWCTFAVLNSMMPEKIDGKVIFFGLPNTYVDNRALIK